MKMKVISEEDYLRKSQLFSQGAEARMISLRVGAEALFSLHLDREFEEFGCLRLYLWVKHNQLSSNITEGDWDSA